MSPSHEGPNPTPAPVITHPAPAVSRPAPTARPTPPGPKLSPIDFWEAFRECGGAKFAFDRIKMLDDRLGYYPDGSDKAGESIHPNESQVETIFIEALNNFDVLKCIKVKALAQLNATNWTEVK